MSDIALDRLKCIQLATEDNLTKEQYETIAELIYQTDGYIYPALFGDGPQGIENAVTILSAVFELNCDSMFMKDNLYIAKAGEKIVGLILWKRGILQWSTDYVLDCARKSNIPLNMSDVEKVKEEYVTAVYSDDELNNETISVINVCISSDVRGKGIASRMLGAFIREHDTEPMELAVVADNDPAIALYTGNGFVIREEYDGFSRTAEKPKCLRMTRTR